MADQRPETLGDPAALRAADRFGVVGAIASAGAQVRALAEQFEPVRLERPRALIVIDGAGAGDADLMAALLPAARVPVSCHPALPAWAGPLDLVVVLATSPDDPTAVSAIAEADHRGAQLSVRAAEYGAVAAAAGAAVLPCRLAIPELTAGPARLAFLLGVARAADLAPGAQELRLDRLADALDAEALACGPAAEPFVNPALALAQHLTGGAGMIIAGDAVGLAVAERGARALRLLGGHPAAAQRAAGLLPGGQLTARLTGPSDPFADPDIDDRGPAPPAAVLVPPVGRDDRAGADIATLARAMPRAMLLQADDPQDPTVTGRATGAASLALRIEFCAAYLGIAAGQVPPADGPDGLGPAGTARAVRAATTVEDVTSDDRDISGGSRWS